MLYVNIDNIDDRQLEFCGYRLTLEGPTHKLYEHIRGDEHVVRNVPPRYLMVGPNSDWSTTNYTSTSTATDGQGNSYLSHIRIVYVVQATPGPSWMSDPLDDGKPSKRRHHLHLIEPFRPAPRTVARETRLRWVPPDFMLAPAARYSARS